MAKVLVPLAQGCEELEAVTIVDLLRRAGIEVITVSLDNEVIVASRGVRLIADALLDDVMQDDFDMIVLPCGLSGAERLDNDERIHYLLKKMQEEGSYTAAICAAPKVLANAGLLAGVRATGYPGLIDKMPLPDTELVDDPVVTDGKVITSRGPGTAMDFALELIEKLTGKEKRIEVEQPLMRPVS